MARVMAIFDPDKWYQCGGCGWWGYFGESVPDKYTLLDIDGPCWQSVFLLCYWCYKEVYLEEDKGAATATASDTTTKTESDTKHTVAANPCLQKTHETEETIERTTAEEMIGG